MKDTFDTRDQHYVFVLETYLLYRESTTCKRIKERQEQTLSVRLSEVSVLHWCLFRESSL